MTTTRSSSTDVTDAESLTVSIVAAVTKATGLDPLDLPPLYEAVDVAVIASHFEPSGGREPSFDQVSFRYVSNRVTVQADGTIAVAPTSEVEQPTGDLFEGRSTVGRCRSGDPRLVRDSDQQLATYYSTEHASEGDAVTVVRDPTRDGAWLHSDHTMTVTP